MAAAKALDTLRMTHFDRNFGLRRVVPESHKVVRFGTRELPSCTGQVTARAGWVNAATLGARKNMRLRWSLESVSDCRRSTPPRLSGLSLRAGVFGSMLALAAVTLGASAAQAADRYATRLSVVDHPQQKATVVEVTFTAVPTYLARFSDEKRRLVVDVIDADVRGVPDTFTRETGIVKSVLVQAFGASNAKTTRLLIALGAPGQASISIVDKRLVIRIEPESGAQPAPLVLRDGKPVEIPPPSTPAPVNDGALAPGTTPTPAPGTTPAPSTTPAPGTAPPHGAAKDRQPRGTDAKGKSAPATSPQVVKVEFERRDNSDWVTVRVSDYASYEQEHPGIGQSRLVIFGARLAPDVPQTLDVRAFGGNVKSVSTSFDEKRQAVVLNVESMSNTVHTLVSEQEGQLSWSFFEAGAVHSSMTGVASDGGVARKARTLHVDESLSHGIPTVNSGEAGGRSAGLMEQIQVEEAAGVSGNAIATSGYTGRRIQLDLKDADVHNVLRLLADVGQVNIVTADNVSGSVTIKMTNVPWDQALDVVLQSKGLGMVRGGNIIRVAPLPQLEKEREMAIARRRQELQLAPLETRLIPVSYATAEDIQSRAREVLSGRGSIAVDARTNVLIARDVAGTLDQVEELVRSLDTQTPQVLVEARIIEANSTYLRQIGIQWGGDASFSAATGNPTGLAFPSSVGLAGGASDGQTPTAGLSPFQATVQNPNFAVNLPATVGQGIGGAVGITLGSVDNNFNLNLRLSAAETSGQVRILSSPRILTLDNHEARISQGTLIPFSQVSAQGVQTTFQEAKLQLLVQPHVTADGSVSMHVKINRDEPDFNQTSARGDPTILKREAETDLLIMDGRTAVIGGIYTRNAGRDVAQVPFFGDIPLLGLLFQRRTARDARGELVIFLTPRIVNRAQALGR
jgi:type IV pilus assembly protein PilQ